MKRQAKTKKVRTEEQKEIIRFIRILLIVVILVVLVYVGTRAFVSKDLFDDKDTTKEVTPGTIDYNKTLIGSAFNRPYDKYYVLIYDEESVDAVKYAAIMSNYTGQKKHEKVYYANLHNELNKSFYTEDKSKVNKDAKTLEDLKVGDLTLLKIEKGKITKYLEDIDEIRKELAVTEK